jgi:hypothetical protein
VARLDNGLALYRYRYKWSDQVYVGVMAQEVLLVRPDAVVRGADGYLRVDYSRLGLHLMTGEEWVASRFETAQNATTTATPPKVMSDAEMDKVTAGTIHPGQGLGTASSTGNNGFINGFNNGLNPHAFPNAQSPGPAGNGLCTAKLICP